MLTVIDDPMDPMTDAWRWGDVPARPCACPVCRLNGRVWPCERELRTIRALETIRERLREEAAHG